jgi:hypothetical protein
MRDYFMDNSVYNKSLEDITKMSGSLLQGNPYASTSNLDNYPTHRSDDGVEYSFATKNWRMVDPNVNDPHKLHNASSNKAYLILKNKHTEEWEFPTGRMYFGDTFYKARNDLFRSISDSWSV